MDKNYVKRIKKIRSKLRNNFPVKPEDVDFLLLELTQLELKLISADILAMTTDVLIKRGVLGSRSLVADARLDYGEPWKYEYVSKKQLKGYQDRIEELKEFLERQTA